MNRASPVLLTGENGDSLFLPATGFTGELINHIQAPKPTREGTGNRGIEGNNGGNSGVGGSRSITNGATAFPDPLLVGVGAKKVDDFGVRVHWKFLLLVLVFVAGFVTNEATKAKSPKTLLPSVDQMGVRSISIHIPDPQNPGRTTYHTLRVFEIQADKYINTVGTPMPNNWIITTGQKEQGAGMGQVTYYATPITEK